MVMVLRRCVVMRAALLINEKDLKEKAEAKTSAVNGKSTQSAI